MAEVKPADVKKLRDATGVGMLDCKNALIEANGNFDEAQKILRKKGLAAATKRSGRATNEGLIFTKINDKFAAILELSCETYFVAKNDIFIKSGNDLVEMIANGKLTETNADVEEKVKEIISIIKENIQLKRLSTMEIADNELVVEYIHDGGSIGVIVKLELSDAAAKSNEAVKQFAFDTALHIAAFSPAYIDQANVDAKYVAEQEEVFKAQTANLDKPEKVIEGIIKGKINKHLSEICLMQQKFVKDDKVSVEAIKKQVEKETGVTIKVKDFVNFQVGQE
ncbi:MAG: elongation factor Ts [Spirochaetales bacterium]|nr:elongation factor Ts [Spirochaetales bacterium]